MTSIVIHIGYHKSGSTYLQKSVFPYLPVNYIFLAGYKRHVLNLVESQKHFDKKYLVNWADSEIDRKYKHNKHGVTIISHEELSGHPHGHRRVDPFATARNLKHAFPNAKILITIRNQLDYLLSIYTYRVAIKGQESRSLEKFLGEEGKLGLFSKLEYDKLAEYYTSLFGGENILVLPLEMLRTKPQIFHNELADFLKVSNMHTTVGNIVNASTNLTLVIQFWRLINFVFVFFIRALRFLHIEPREEYPYLKLRGIFYTFKRATTKYLNKVFKSSKKLYIAPPTISDKLLKRYAESNVRLHKLTNLNLKDYGYPYPHTDD